MAEMVAISAVSSSMVSIQEKGSRNKRKFHADLPSVEMNSLLMPASPNELPVYDIFPLDKTPDICGFDNLGGACGLCKTATVGSNLGLELDEFQDADWSDITEGHLEEMLLSNLDLAFRSAVKKVATFGYSEDAAMNAVLSSGHCHGCKDTVSNIVENALAFLKSAKEMECSPRENVTEDLKKLEKIVLADMISVLREVRPFFNMGDAMWLLLMSDANVSQACAMDSNSFSNGEIGETTCTSIARAKSNNVESLGIPDLNVHQMDKLSSLSSHSQSTSEKEMPKVAGVPCLHNGKPSASKPKPIKDNSHSSSNVVEESSFLTVSRSLLEEKPVNSRKVHLGTSRRDSILRQKTIHFEKSYRALGSRAVLRACKQSGLGNLMLDRRCKATFECTTTSSRSTMKIEKTVEVNKSLADANLNLSFSSGPASGSSNGKKVSNKPPVPVKSTELSLSLPSIVTSGTSSIQELDTGVTHGSSYSCTPFDKICRDWIPEDKKDEMLLLLVPLMRELQCQLQDWTDWAQQKVMQATHRLTKDKGELQTLRQEREEVNRLQKEKQTLEENTKKKLAEIEGAITKASSQVGKANATARKLELENAQLRLEMEAAKLQAAESATKCQEVSRRELETLKMFQSWNRQKGLFQEELAAEKLLLRQLQRQFEQFKELHHQSEAKWKQEEKLKDEALAKANYERKEQEQIETSARSQETALRLKVDNDLQRSKNDIRTLEQQIAQLKLAADLSSTISVPRWISDKTYASFLSDGKINLNSYFLANIIDSHELGLEDVQRERECVMCLSDEMSVVFLPCAHQVVCTKCNDLHEKQGMKDCPSCRTLIQRRISVRSGF